MDKPKNIILKSDEDYSEVHPLELFAFFRSWPNIRHPMLRSIVLTIVFNALIAMLFMLMAIIMGKVQSWGEFVVDLIGSLIYSNIIGFTWTLAMMLIGPLLRRINKLPLSAVIACYTVFGFIVTQLAYVGIFYFNDPSGGVKWNFGTEYYISTLALSFLISLILSVSYRARIRGLQREAGIARESERLQVVQRQAAQANLRALQAQIEPHFLFNTLANVVGLIHPQPDKAKVMLEQFIVYLRATLSATREEHSTLGSEFEMMKNFLAILQIRMGERLQVRFDLPADLADMPIPPMLLQPLVENSIKHGLEPKIEGGEVTLSVKRVGGGIAITIADTGLGFQDSKSNGIGLKNVSERVKQLYGNAGSLSIEDNQPCGTRITILIPEIKTPVLAAISGR